jgi:hypothetical protein
LKSDLLLLNVSVLSNRLILLKPGLQGF